MALYLRNFLYDTALLPFPEHSAFDYSTLLDLAQEFHLLCGRQEDDEWSKLDPISLQVWTMLAAKHLGLNEDEALVYFETFAMLAPSSSDGSGSWPHEMELDPVQFLLLLFNQLYKRPLIRDSMLKGDEFPRRVQFTHHPLSRISGLYSSTEDPRQKSFEDFSDILPAHSHSEHLSPPKFPSTIVEGRHHLTSFWRSSSKRWIQLIFVAFNGRQIDSIMDEHHEFGIELQLHQLQALDFLFTGVRTQNDQDRSFVKKSFQNWVSDPLRKDLDTEMLRDVRLTSENAVELLAHFNDVSAESKTTISLEKIDRWVSWAILERPLSYQSLQTTDHGFVYGVESHITPNDGFEDDYQVLLARKRGQVLLITADHVAGKSLFIYRCHDVHIFVLGAVKNLYIARCRNTSIFVGAVAGTLSMSQCQSVTLSGTCNRFILPDSLHRTSFSGPIGSHGLVVHLHTNLRPLISQQSLSLEPSKEGEEYTPAPVMFAPCNQYYPGMLRDIQEIGLDLNHNEWDNPRMLWQTFSEMEFSDRSNGKIFSTLSPTQFFMHCVPFDLVDTDALVDVQQGKDDEYTALFEALPSSYKRWMTVTKEVADKTKAIIAQLNGSEQVQTEFRSRIEEEFQIWLKKSGQSHVLSAFINLGQDLEKQIPHNKVFTASSSNATLDGDVLSQELERLVV